jgi:hypothetical protein
MYPIFTQPKHQPVSFDKKGEAAPPHIPAWLPAFPDQHTYKSTAVFQGRQDDQKQQRQVCARALLLRCRAGKGQLPSAARPCRCPGGALRPCKNGGSGCGRAGNGLGHAVRWLRGRR